MACKLSSRHTKAIFVEIPAKTGVLGVIGPWLVAKNFPPGAAKYGTPYGASRTIRSRIWFVQRVIKLSAR